MKRAMLEVVAAGVVATSDDVERYLKCRCVSPLPSQVQAHSRHTSVDRMVCMVLRLVVRQRAVAAMPAVLSSTLLVASPVVHLLLWWVPLPVCWRLRKTSSRWRLPPPWKP